MAKRTKDSNLSIEVKLEQALIPVWDEPYKLPENWCWVKIGSINNYVGHSINPANTPSDKFELYSVPSSDGDYPEIVLGNEIGSTKQSVEKEDVLLCKINPRINRVWKVSQHTENTLLASSEWIIIRNKHIVSDYLMWCLRSPYFREFMLSNVSGVGGSLMRAQPKHVRNYPVPLPPFGEQKRITSTLKDLFAKLDEAKEKAQEVVDGFEVRKAAILHKAFSGELTAKWREENGIDAASYNKRRFDEVAIIKSNLVDPVEYKDYPHIAPDNIEKKTGVLLEYRTIAEDGVKSGKHRFYPGQILYSKIRPNLSKVVVIDFDGLCSADMYPIEAIGDTKCLWYYMLSENFLEQASSAGSRSVLPKINQKELSALTVSIPDSIEEQKELSRLIDSLLTKEYQVKESAEAVVGQIDTMKKAILARAFRGGLGTNDPTEENAKELLRKIL